MSAMNKSKPKLNEMTFLSCLLGIAVDGLGAKLKSESIIDFFQRKSSELAKRSARYQLSGRPDKAISAAALKVMVDGNLADSMVWRDPSLARQLSLDALQAASALSDAGVNSKFAGSVAVGLAHLARALKEGLSVEESANVVKAAVESDAGLLGLMARSVSEDALHTEARARSLAGDPSWRECLAAANALSKNSEEKKLARSLMSVWLEGEATGPSPSATVSQLANWVVERYERPEPVSIKDAIKKLKRSAASSRHFNELSGLKYEDFLSAVKEAAIEAQARMEQRAQGVGVGAKLAERRELDKASSAPSPSAQKRSSKTL